MQELDPERNRSRRFGVHPSKIRAPAFAFGRSSSTWMRECAGAKAQFLIPSSPHPLTHTLIAIR